jgi:hypothetical protein
MASQKDKKPAITTVATAVNVLAQSQELLSALGRTVIVLKRVQKAVGEDKSTLSTNALELRDKIAEVQNRHDILFAELQKCGVLKKDAK